MVTEPNKNSMQLLQHNFNPGSEFPSGGCILVCVCPICLMRGFLPTNASLKSDQTCPFFLHASPSTALHSSAVPDVHQISQSQIKIQEINTSPPNRNKMEGLLL